MELEKRIICHAKQELRTETDVDGKVWIAGLAVPYGQPSEDCGGFCEIVERGTFAESLKGDRDVFADVEHDEGKKLARRSIGTLELKEQKDGLHFRLAVPATTLGRDVQEEVRSGLLDGVSIAFSDAKSQWTGKGENVVRKINKATLHAVSLTSYPAYRQTVGSLVLRSLEEYRRTAEEAESTETQPPPEVPAEVLGMKVDLALAEAEILD